jgi:carboxyl-terminal processing protease
VVSVLPGSPADKEHLTDGDVIESIGDQSTRELSLAVIRLMLEGKPGTTVTLSVVRPRKADPDKLTLTRTIAAPARPLASSSTRRATILYLKPGALTASRVDEIAAKLKAAGKGRKVLLDLRDSSGGDAQQGVRLANFFIKQGTLATLEGQKFPRQTFTADPAKFLTDAPLAVLVNRGTYGPAELTAAAIEDPSAATWWASGPSAKARCRRPSSCPTAPPAADRGQVPDPPGKKIQDEAVTPTVVVGQASIDEEDEGSAARQGRRAAQQGAPTAEGEERRRTPDPRVPAASASATPPTTPPGQRKSPAFFCPFFTPPLRILHLSISHLWNRPRAPCPCTAWFAEALSPFYAKMLALG